MSSAQNESNCCFPQPLAHLFMRSSLAERRIHWNAGARRTEVRPFTPAQIKLLETFADQAVIAIENVRLFQRAERIARTANWYRRNPGVIASSPTDIQPVLDTIAENAARLCAAEDALDQACEGNDTRWVAHFG